jgi:hypothetical protein
VVCGAGSTRPLPRQESAQHRIADFHARDAAAAWLVLACQSIAVWPEEALLAEACLLPSALVAMGLELDEAIVRAALTCVLHDPSASQDRLLSVVEGERPDWGFLCWFSPPPLLCTTPFISCCPCVRTA